MHTGGYQPLPDAPDSLRCPGPEETDTLVMELFQRLHAGARPGGAPAAEPRPHVSRPERGVEQQHQRDGSEGLRCV